MVESIKNTISRMEPRKANNNNAAPQTENKSTLRDMKLIQILNTNF